MKKKNIIGVILLLTGIIVLLIPVGWKLVVKHQQKQMLQTIKEEIQSNKSAEPEEPEMKQAIEFSKLELEAVDEEEQEAEPASKAADILKGQKVIGIIEIKKLDMVFPIVEGAERGNIRAAIGHMKETAALGSQGNCVLAGHRGGIYGEFFKYINKLEKDDIVTVTDAEGTEYEYRVYDQFVVEPEDMYVTEAIGEEYTLTLVSCEEDGSKRLILRCRREQ